MMPHQLAFLEQGHCLVVWDDQESGSFCIMWLTNPPQGPVR